MEHPIEFFIGASSGVTQVVGLGFLPQIQFTIL